MAAPLSTEPPSLLAPEEAPGYAPAVHLLDVLTRVTGSGPESGWEVTDEDVDAGLIQLHYTETANMAVVRSIYGTVVDVNSGLVVCQSSSFAPTLVASEIKEIDGNIEVIDISGVKKLLPLAECTFQPGFDMTIVRFFLHEGVVWGATHRRLRYAISQWGAPHTFGELWTLSGGPPPETFFDMTKKYSPYCHTFFIAHPQVSQACKLDLKGGFIGYLATYNLWNPAATTYGVANCETTQKPIANLTNDVAAARDQHPPSGGRYIYWPPPLSLAEANRFLRDGWYAPITNLPDSRFGLGELVFVQHRQANGSRLPYKIVSPAYHWRTEVRANAPNLYERFYQLSDVFENDYLSERIQGALNKLIPVIPNWSLSDLAVYQLTWPTAGRPPAVDPATPAGRRYLVTIALARAVPLAYYLEVLGYGEMYLKDRQALLNELHRIWQAQLVNDPEIGEKVRGFLNEANGTYTSQLRNKEAAASHLRRSIIKIIEQIWQRSSGKRRYRLRVELTTYRLARELASRPAQPLPGSWAYVVATGNTGSTPSSTT